MSSPVLDNSGIVTVHSDAVSPMLHDIVAEVSTADQRPSARRIAAAIGRMIRAGSLPVGARLPTIRELSGALGVSPTTVSEAWRSLTAVGAIEPHGRNGTCVRHPTGPGAPRRYRRITEGPGHFGLDLSSGTPDPALLPELGPLFSRVSRQSLTSSYLDHPVLPELEQQLIASWPFTPEAVTVVNGAMDGLDRVCRQVLRLGDRVVVEHPTFAPLLDLLELLGCEVIGVELDDEGPVVDGLRQALGHEPRAVFLQPRAHNPSGISITARRAAELADLLSSTAAILVEDDHTNVVSSSALVSLGAWFPDRTIHIRSYSKSHGPDLRLAALGGAGDIVTGVTNRRLLGPGWSSRILQALLLELLRDPGTVDVLAAARSAYARRRATVSKVLAHHQVPVTGGDGINLWMQVDDERAAVVALAARGIGVAPGAPFMVNPDRDHLRVTVGLLDGDDDHVADVAEQLATAAGHAPARTGRR